MRFSLKVECHRYRCPLQSKRANEGLTHRTANSLSSSSCGWSQTQQKVVAGDERQIHDLSRSSRKKAVGRVAARAVAVLGGQQDLVGEKRFLGGTALHECDNAPRRRIPVTHLPPSMRRLSLFRPKLDILLAAQRLIWEDLSQVPSSFVLYGGTAMARRLGHRQSVDFDFFSNERFEPSNLFWSLSSLREARVDHRGDNTLSVVVDRSGPIRLSFFGDVRMNRIHDPDLAPDNRLQVGSPLDLTATKLKKVQRRAEAKDYRDVAAALDAGIGLAEALAAATAVFGKTFNAMAALKALTYFGDGNLASLPQTIQDCSRTSAE
jgi:Nucleotidyl transferase AbiEii toxin, Type IV TA system